MYVERKVRPSNWYFLAVAINLGLGCFSVGFALTGNTDVGDILAVRKNWSDDDAERNNKWIATSATIGLSLGSVMSNLITASGRRLAIILMNLLMVLISIPTFFTSNYWVIIFQRFAIGYTSAVIINASSLYISETFPTEIQTKFGTFLNLGICLGILIMLLVGLGLP